MRFFLFQTLAERSLSPPPPGRYLHRLHCCLKLLQPRVRWQMAVAGQMSCMVHTTGLPLFTIFRMVLSESIPWLIHDRWITSACLNSRNEVMSAPVLATSMAKRLWRLKWRCQKIVHLSQRKRHRLRTPLGNATTTGLVVCLSRTSIRACTPLLFRAETSLPAATAAPPVRSLVLTISIRVLYI